jgi:hypothetical protein
MREFLASDPEPLEVCYRFERTETWDADTAFAAPLDLSIESTTALRREHLVDELRLARDSTTQWSFQTSWTQALAMVLSRREAVRARVTLKAAEVDVFRRRWLAARRLDDADALAQWCQRNHLVGPAFDEFIVARAQEACVAEMARDLIETNFADALRLSDQYATLAARASAKQRMIESAAGGVSLAESEFSNLDLLSWYCGERLHVPLPTDVKCFADGLGFPDAESLYRALLRERLYVQLNNSRVVGHR